MKRTSTKTYVLDASDEKKETGWQCPVCGRGNSPHINQCPCYQSIPQTPWPTPVWPTFPYYWPPRVID